MGGAASVLPPDMLESMSRMDHDAQLRLFQFVRKRIHAKEEELGVSREAKDLATERARRIEAEAAVRALKQRLDKFLCLARDIGEADNTSTNSTSMFNSSAIANETYPEVASPPPSEQEQLSSNTPSFFSSPLQHEQKRRVKEAVDAGHHYDGDGGDSKSGGNNRLRVLSGYYSDSESGASSSRHNKAADTGPAALQPQPQPHPQQPPAFLSRVRTVSLPSSPSPRKLPPPAVAARVAGQLENILPGPAVVDDALEGSRTEDTLKIMTMTRSEPRRVEHSFYARERTEVSVDIGALVEVLDVSLRLCFASFVPPNPTAITLHAAEMIHT